VFEPSLFKVSNYVCRGDGYLIVTSVSEIDSEQEYLQSPRGRLLSLVSGVIPRKTAEYYQSSITSQAGLSRLSPEKQSFRTCSSKDTLTLAQ
jgi:hypothetical protein